MKENIKILAGVGIAFLVAFGILFLFFTMYEEGFFANIQTNEVKPGVKNKIFVLGLSYVEKSVNATHVENTLNKAGFAFSVIIPPYDELPLLLENRLDTYIEHTPKLVMYGVGFEDLGLDNTKQCEFDPNIIIPPYNIQKNVERPNIPDTEIEEKSIGTNIFLQNPKRVTLEVFENILGKKKIEYVNEEDTQKKEILINPFEHNEIRSILDLNRHLPYDLCMDFDVRDGDLNSLDIIFAEFHKNDIDVIAYIPPYTQVYLDAVPPTLKKDLISNVKSITEKYDFQFHDLSTKWKNENIFSDHIHVASNPKSLIYSETLATLIIPTQRQDYTSSEISDELFSRKDLSETNLSFVDLSGKDLSDKDLSYTNFYGANLANTDLSFSDLTNSVLANADLTNTNLEGTILTGADLTYTRLANEE